VKRKPAVLAQPDFSHDRLATIEIIGRVAEERERQERLRLAGKFSFTCADPHIPFGGKMMVLAEEFGEVAQAAYECYDPKPQLTGPTEGQLLHLKEELIQLAAVAVAWAESISET
jgi:hypothetical protein